MTWNPSYFLDCIENQVVCVLSVAVEERRLPIRLIQQAMQPSPGFVAVPSSSQVLYTLQQNVWLTSVLVRPAMAHSEQTDSVLTWSSKQD